jgi:hypothetical protein
MMFLVVGFTSPTPKPTLKESSYPVKKPTDEQVLKKSGCRLLKNTQR